MMCSDSEQTENSFRLNHLTFIARQHPLWTQSAILLYQFCPNANIVKLLPSPGMVIILVFVHFIQLRNSNQMDLKISQFSVNIAGGKKFDDMCISLDRVWSTCR